MPLLVFVIAVVAMLYIAILFMFIRFNNIAPQGTALVRTGSGGIWISFDRMMVLPVFHKVESMDIKLKHFTIVRENSNGLICHNNVRVNLHMRFFMCINLSEGDVIKIAQGIGCNRASDIEQLKALFETKFSEAMKIVAKEFDYEDLLKHREEYKHKVLDVIGSDLSGYVLSECSIVHLSLTPQKYLSPDNILDAQGLRFLDKKLAEVTGNVKSAEGQEKSNENLTHSGEQNFKLELQKGEMEAIHQANLRHLHEQSELDARIICLEVKMKAETNNETGKRLEKQIDELNKKRADLITQLEVEKKSIKVRYQRKLLATKRSNELPPA